MTVAAVRRLHHEISIDALAYACIEGDCKHYDAGVECPIQPVAVCAECYAIAESMDDEQALRAEEYVAWPCSTIRRIQGPTIAGPP